jgi:hypothetical protein
MQEQVDIMINSSAKQPNKSMYANKNLMRGSIISQKLLEESLNYSTLLLTAQIFTASEFHFPNRLFEG